MIRAHAVPGAVFKKCCLKNGLHDGAVRDIFFPRMNTLPVRLNNLRRTGLQLRLIRRMSRDNARLTRIMEVMGQ